MFDWLDNQFDALTGVIFTQAVQPLLYHLGLINYDELAYDGITAFLYGVFQITLVYVLVRPLEALVPAEPWPDRKGVRVDILYTFLTRLGIMPLIFFFILTPLTNSFEGALRLHNLIPGNLEQLSPWLDANPLYSFFVYLLVLDFANYWRHRLQHQFNVWWALHSLHHSQRMLSFWADDRNHVLDDAVEWIWFSLAATIVGVPPGQFVGLVAVGRMVESLSHANVRFGFGPIGDRILVSPKFHRLHHAMGIGHEGRKHGCNFATLFPIWDIVFRTADFTHVAEATGVRDQLAGRDYGEDFLTQQWLGLKRMFGLDRELAPQAAEPQR